MKLRILARNLNRIESYLDRQEARISLAADKKITTERLKKSKEKLVLLKNQLEKEKNRLKKYNKENKEAGSISNEDNDSIFRQLKRIIDIKQEDISNQISLIRRYEKQLKTAK